MALHAHQLSDGVAVGTVRRTPYAFFYAEDEFTADLPALLRGEAPAPGGTAHILALAILTGERHRLSREDLDVLLSVPSDRWVRAEPRSGQTISELAQKGLLLSDSADDRGRELRERDQALSDGEWNAYAALYHYMTQWSGVWIAEGEAEPEQLRANSRTTAQEVLRHHGPPPEPFAKREAVSEVALPGAEREGGLYRALMARRTVRAFRQDAPMTLQQLDVALRYVFGCHGYTRNAADVLCIKRTSPSGGGMHPIEVYPVISNVAGIGAGIYHYDARRHSLALLGALEPAEARDAATSFMCGQRYFGTAPVSFVLTCRFYRNHWKYRRHQKAYAGILMDAAHLSQTLYLVAADLGLGAYITLAINARDIEERLGLDGISEGVIAMTGCGAPAPYVSPLEPRFSAP